MGTLFMVNPPERVNPPTRKSRKRRSAAQRRATAKMLAARKRKLGAKKRRRTATKPTIRRKRKGASIMAKRRRRRTTARRAAPRRRRRSSAKRRSPVTSLRRHAVYQTNPRRRRRIVGKRRRRSYRRNPTIIAQLQQGAMDAGATLVGGAVARIATGFLPLPKTGVMGAASGLAVALGVGIAARRFVSHDTARFLTAGAMQVPIKNLITSFVPQAGAFLGDYDNISAYALPSGDGMGNYLSPGMYGAAEAQDVEIGVYE